MDVKLHPLILMRNPACSYLDYTAEQVQEYCRSAQFREAIFASSPALYAALEKIDFAYSRMDKRQRTSVLRYFNRMCFRPTPFGLFSSFTVLHSQETGEKIRFATDAPFAYVEPSRAADLRIARPLEELLEKHLRYRANSTLYSFGKEFRFYRKELKEGSSKFEFSLESLDHTPLLKLLAAGCRNAVDPDALFGRIIGHTDCSEAEAQDYVAELLTKQFLVRDPEPGITGRNYTQQLLDFCESHHLTGPVVQAAKVLSACFSTKDLALTTRANRINECLAESGALPLPESSLFYTVAERTATGSLSPQLLRDLQSAVTCLDKLMGSTHTPPALKTFAANFKQRFDERAMSLMIALDHQLGVSYGDSYAVREGDDVLETIAFSKEEPGNSNITWTAGHRLLLKLWNTAGRDTGSCISITDDDLAGLESDPAALYPTGFPVLFRVANGKLHIEQAGGASAMSLAGRFTLFNTAIAGMGKELAEQEEKSNPDVVFAEIVHVCDEHADNINRRCTLRQYEIPLICHSERPDEFRLLPNELMVKVMGKQVILYSPRLKKRVIPRLSTAFNYSRNDLPVFRFLCDLQYQGLRCHFTLMPEQLFPGLPWYPRIEYKGTILHLATWHLSAAQIDRLTQKDTIAHSDTLSALLGQMGLPRYFSVTEHDHQLVIDREQPQDLLLFVESIRQKDKIIIKEFIPDDRPLSAAISGRPFINQFVASCYTEQLTYHAVEPWEEKKSVRRKFAPGSQWLYIKIYCHPSHLNTLISEKLYRVLTKLPAEQPWFFIRYTDPGPHLRVRIKLNRAATGKMLTTIEGILRKDIRFEKVEKMQADTYHRELERYNSQLIEQTEAVFYRSSQLVAKFIRRSEQEKLRHSYFSFALVTVRKLLGSLFRDPANCLAFLSSARDGYLAEYTNREQIIFHLDQRFRKLRNEVEAVMNDEKYLQELRLRDAFDLLYQAHGRLNRKCKILPAGEQSRLYVSLLHMHMNRIFQYEPREQEMAVYHFLFKQVLAESKRKKV